MTKLSAYTHVDVSKNSLTDENIFNNFKRDSNYTKILEHTTTYYANEYIVEIFKNHSKYAQLLDWEKLKENDRIGNPIISDFRELKNYGIILNNYKYSPSTIYYIYRGLDIINKLFKEGESIRILEIGGGYGGQCKILLDMCKMLKINIETYGIIDLEYPSKLQKKYLDFFDYSNVQFYEFEYINDFDKFKDYNKLIAIYSLSEFEVDVQNFYIDNIIKNIPNYYILCNVEITESSFFKNDKLLDTQPKINRYHKLIINND